MGFLLKASLIISFAGILSLLLISDYQQPTPINTRSVQNLNLGDFVEISGKIANEKTYKKDFSVLTLTDRHGSVRVVCGFCSKQEEFANQTVKITGKVSIYRDAFQISADKISGLKNNGI